MPAATLVGRGLADLMSAGMRAAESGRLDQELNPPEAVVGPLTAALEARVGPSVVMAVAELGGDELSAALHALQDFEEELSSACRSLHHAIDALNTELARPHRRWRIACVSELSSFRRIRS